MNWISCLGSLPSCHYHNPIELAWAKVKKEIRKKNKIFPVKKLEDK
jgi:hypothetical protein